MPSFKLTTPVLHDGEFHDAGSIVEIGAKDAERFPEGALEPAKAEEPKKPEEPLKGKDGGK